MNKPIIASDIPANRETLQEYTAKKYIALSDMIRDLEPPPLSSSPSPSLQKYDPKLLYNQLVTFLNESYHDFNRS